MYIFLIDHYDPTAGIKGHTGGARFTPIEYLCCLSDHQPGVIYGSWLT